MGYFDCCYHCPSTKRYPGCHDKCPDYLKAKKSLDADNAIKRSRALEESLISKPKSKVQLKYRH